MLSVTTNVSSLIAQNNLNQTNSALQTSLQRLSSGLKINSGADGPAAYVISNEQQAQVVGLQTAISNTSQASNIVQIADGALSTIANLLDQIRSLALDSANSGANDSSALAANQAQVTSALQTIDNIAQNTQYGTKKLLNGTAGLTGTTDNSSISFLNAAQGAPTGTFAVDVTQAAQTADVVAGTQQTAALSSNETLTINGVSVALTAGQTQAQVINTINQYTGQTGVTAQQNATTGATELYSSGFGSGATISVQSNVDAAADSSGFGTTQITANGVDVAGTIGGFAATGNGNVLTGTTGSGAQGISVSVGLASGSNTTSAAGALGNVTINDNSLVFQIGANANQTVAVNIGNVQTTALGLNVAGVQFANLNQVNVQSESGAQDTIKIVDAAISQVSTLSGQLGAIQSNTLQQTSNNLNSTLENTTAALSNIRDTDFAAETANYSQDQVLMQVGTTVLSNANQNSQLVLNLMKNM